MASESSTQISCYETVTYAYSPCNRLLMAADAAWLLLGLDPTLQVEYFL